MKELSMLQKAPNKKLTEEEKKNQITENIKTGLLRYMTVMRSLAWKHSENHNITPLQGEILCVLQARGVMRLKEIAHETGLTAATTSDAVSTLCYKGLCEKSRDIGDARALAVRLTPKGIDLAFKTNRDCWLAITNSIKRLKSEEQVSIYKSILKMLTEFEEKELISSHRSCLNCSYYKLSAKKQECFDKSIFTRGSNLDSSKNFCVKYNEEFTDVYLRLDCPAFLAAEQSKITNERKLFFKI